jgi:hypothetical protein
MSENTRAYPNVETPDVLYTNYDNYSLGAGLSVVVELVVENDFRTVGFTVYTATENVRIQIDESFAVPGAAPIWRTIEDITLGAGNTFDAIYRKTRGSYQIAVTNLGLAATLIDLGTTKGY